MDTLSMYLEAYREEIGWGFLAASGLAVLWLLRKWWTSRQDEVALAIEDAAFRCRHGVSHRGSACRKCARDFAEECANDKPDWRWVVECDVCHGIFDGVFHYANHKCKSRTADFERRAAFKRDI